MADNVIQIIIRAKDEAAAAFAKVGATISGLRGQLNSLPAATKSFDDLTGRATRLGQALGSGNILSAAREFGGIVGAANKAGAAVGEAGTAAEGAAAGFGALNASAIIAGASVVALGIAAIATAAAVLRAADEGARYADSIGDLAARTGIAVEDLSRLAFAAEQSDVSIDALATSLKFLQRNMIDVKTGSGEAYDALIALGFSGEEVKRGLGDTQETLLAISSRFAAIEDPALRTALALKIFGRSGDALIPFLTQGPDKINELIAASDRLGITVSSTSAKIGDDYTHALERLNGAVRGLKVQISTGVTPAVTEFVENLTEMVAAINTTHEVMQTPLPLDKMLPPGAARDFALAVDRMRHALELFDRVAALGVATIDLPDLPPQSPAGADHVASGRTGQFFGTPVKSGADGKPEPLTRSDIAPLEQQAIIEAAEKAAESTKRLKDEAREAAKAIAELVTEYDKTLDRAYLVSEGLAESLKLAFGIKPATGLVKDFEKALEDAAEAAGKIKLPTNDKGEPLSAADAVNQATRKELAAGIGGKREALDDAGKDLKPRIFEAIEPASELAAIFERIGINVADLNERLAVMGESVNSLGVLCEALGATMNTAFSEAFDPLRVGMDGIGQAVGNFRNTFDDAFANLANKIESGNLSMLRFSNIVEGAAKAMHRLVIELGLAIIKALILKAIGGFLGLASGGTVTTRGVDSGTGFGGLFASTGGTTVQRSGGPMAAARAAVPAFSSGGTYAAAPRSGGNAGLYARAVAAIPSFHDGGTLLRAAVIPALVAGGVALSGGAPSFASIPGYAGGAFSVPGSTQAKDSVLAYLAPGETAILPTIGGARPSETVAKLAALSDRFTSAERQKSSAPDASLRTIEASRDAERHARERREDMGSDGGPMIGELHIHANDWESVRNSVRPGGEFDRQMARRDELGR